MQCIGKNIVYPIPSQCSELDVIKLSSLSAHIAFTPKSSDSDPSYMLRLLSRLMLDLCLIFKP